MAQTLNGVGGTPEVWLVDGTYYLVYYVPETDPPVPIAWQVRTEQELKDISPGGAITVDRTMTTAQADAAGWLLQGFDNELKNTDTHPWDSFVADYAELSQIHPWLSDPEMVAIAAAAHMEGREITEAELKTTEYWQTHSQAERDWLLLNLSDPATAEKLMEDTRLITADAIMAAGINNAGEGLINFIADQVTQGLWSQEYASWQIRNLAEGGRLGPIDEQLQRWLDLAEVPLDTTMRREDEVRRLVARWLGPAHAAGWTDANYEEWAFKARNDPDALQELESLLQQQRLVIFPHVENKNLSYEDIAAPFRNVWQRMWGSQPDEMDEFFLQMVASNDINQAQTMLRKRGLEEGNAQVAQDATAAMARSFGTGPIGVQ